MPATTTEGTGSGSAADILPKIYNGVVKGANIQDGSITAADIAPGAVSGGGAVSSVAGRTGNVTLSASDISGLSGVATSGSYDDLTDLPPKVKVVNMTYAPTLNTDATTGDMFNVTLTGSVTLANPTGGVDGQTIRWRITQDGNGGRAVTLGDKFVIPSSATSPLPFSTAANKMDVLAATYHAGRDKWDIIAFVMGY